MLKYKMNTQGWYSLTAHALLLLYSEVSSRMLNVQCRDIIVAELDFSI